MTRTHLEVFDKNGNCINKNCSIYQVDYYKSLGYTVKRVNPQDNVVVYRGMHPYYSHISDNSYTNWKANEQVAGLY